MMQYAKTPLCNTLSIDSVVTVFHNPLTGLEPTGESHNFWELIYVDSGTFDVSIDNNNYTIEEGQIIVYPPLAYHIGTKPSTSKINIVSFETTSEIMSYFANKVITLSNRQRQYLSQVISIGENYFRKLPLDSTYNGMMPYEGTDALVLQSLKNHLELLLIDIYIKKESTKSDPKKSNYENRSNDIFNKLTLYLKDNIEKKITLDDICKNCTIGLSKLKKICQEQCGMSPMSYFISLKIDASKAMITDTSMNFTQISEKLGFSSVHHFSRAFKNKVGVSPSEYAKLVHKN